MKIGIIGGGRLGCCLADYLHQHDFLIGITASTKEHSIALAEQFQLPVYDNQSLIKDAEVILLTLPDRLLAPVAASLAKSVFLEGKIFLHCSGSLGIEVLNPLQEQGAHIGSMHPLQSFSGGKTKLTGVYMAVDGDALAKETAETLVNFFGGKAFFVPPAERTIYHAAACICSNYVVALESVAQQLMARWLGDDKSAWDALKPLFCGTATNLLQTDALGKALTGPIARGDASTVQKHLSILPGKYHPLYSLLGLEAVKLVQTQHNIDDAAIQQLTEILQKHCGNTKEDK